MASRHRFQVGGRIRTVRVEQADGLLRVAIDDGEPFVVDATIAGVPGAVSMIVDHQPARAYVSRSGTGYRVWVDGRTFDLQPAGSTARGRGAVGGATDPPGKVTAPIAGMVVEVRVQVGDTVEEGQSLLVIEAMKMQNEVQTPHSGTITALHIEQGTRVEKGELLVEYDVAEE